MIFPFEPLATCFLYHLSIQAAFLVAIMSGRGTGEIRPFVAGLLFLLCPAVFHEDRGLRPHMKFRSKVASEFHISLFTSRFSSLDCIPAWVKWNITHWMSWGPILFGWDPAIQAYTRLFMAFAEKVKGQSHILERRSESQTMSGHCAKKGPPGQVRLVHWDLDGFSALLR